MMRRRSFAEAFSRFLPSNVISSALTMPGAAIRPISAIIVTLLPEPDSPTTPTTSPGATSRLMRSTAGRPLKFTARLRMVNSEVMSCHPFQFGIECIAQPVAEQIDREHRDQDGQTRHRDDPPCAVDVI